LFGFLILAFLPFATAEGEWIKDDQQGELSERSEFSPCRLSSFRIRVPEGQGIGGPFSAYSFWASKKSKAACGDATPTVLILFFKIPREQQIGILLLPTSGFSLPQIYKF